MKAIRKSDGKVIEVEPQRFMEQDGSMYAPSDLDFNVEEAEQTESAVIQGWVARNNEPCHGYDLHLFTSKPIRRQIMGDWYGYGETKLDTKLFPSLTWESDPIEVELTIKPKKQGTMTQSDLQELSFKFAEDHKWHNFNDLRSRARLLRQFVTYIEKNSDIKIINRVKK